MDRKKLERNIISAVFTDENLIDDLIEVATENHFTCKNARKVYEWVLNRYKNSESISLIKAKSDLGDVVDNVIFEEQMVFEFDDWLKELDVLHTRDILKKSAKKIHNLANKDGMTIEGYVSTAQEIIFSATSKFADDNEDYTLQEALMEAYTAYIEELETGKVNGIMTHFPSVDNNIGGLKEGHLTVIAGSTSMGKTAFGLSLVDKLIKHDTTTHFVTLEMNSKELVDRLLIMNSNVKAKEYNKRRLTKVQQKALDTARSKLSDYDKNLIISEKRGLSVEEIKANCRKMYKKYNTDVIIVDYLQRIRLKGDKSVNKEVGEIANSLKDLAGELNVPVILLSQLNRKVDGVPKLKHLRDSGEIEEAADEVWFVYRPSYNKDVAEQEEEYRQEARVIHAKGRTTGVGVSNFYFYKDLTLWVDAYTEDVKNERPRMLLTRHNTKGEDI
jgi:replicative DNA helicase